MRDTRRSASPPVPVPWAGSRKGPCRGRPRRGRPARPSWCVLRGRGVRGEGASPGSGRAERRGSGGHMDGRRRSGGGLLAGMGDALAVGRARFARVAAKGQPALALLMLGTVPSPADRGPGPAGRAAPAAVYRGVEGETAVAVPRLDGDVDVDGVLDEAPWAEAALLTGFSQYLPVDGLPAADSTEVLVWYSAHAPLPGRARARAPRARERDARRPGPRLRRRLRPDPAGHLPRRSPRASLRGEPAGGPGRRHADRGAARQPDVQRGGGERAHRPVAGLRVRLQGAGHRRTATRSRSASRSRACAIRPRSRRPGESTFCARSSTRGSSRPGRRCAAARRRSSPRAARSRGWPACAAGSCST